MALDADVHLALGGFRLDAHVRADLGGLLVLVGPNAAGKSTFLRALAGLHRIDGGRITLDATTLDDGDGVWVPPHRRRVGLVPQDDRLLPHLTAAENVAFGLRHQAVKRRDARAQAMRWLEVVGLSGAAERRPHELSGGQVKRVALARALAIRPRVLLLDEPFAGLDATTRREIRRELRTYLAAHECVRILVTHEPVDALALGDRVVVLEHGHVVQDVPPDQLRVRPRSRYVADLVGVNLYRGTATAHGLRTEQGVEIVAADHLEEEASDALAVIHPRAVAVHRDAPEGSPRNVWSGTVTDIDDEGDRLRLRVEGELPLVAEVTRGAATALGIGVGTRVFASVKATEVTLYPS